MVAWIAMLQAGWTNVDVAWAEHAPLSSALAWWFSLLWGMEKCPQKVPSWSELHNIQQLVLLLDHPLHSGFFCDS